MFCPTWSQFLLNKVDIRQQLRVKRSAISIADRKTAAEDAAKSFIKSQFFQNSQHIACYLACKEEFDCSPIIHQIWQAKKNCYLPVMQENSALVFTSYQANMPLALNAHHIWEPTLTNIFSIEQLDIILLPLVGFDRQGHRLGMGGGYYDRTLETLTKKKPFLIGLGYQCQEVESLPHDSWDVPLDAVLTEKVFFLTGC